MMQQDDKYEQEQERLRNRHEQRNNDHDEQQQHEDNDDKQRTGGIMHQQNQQKHLKGGGPSTNHLKSAAVPVINHNISVFLTVIMIGVVYFKSDLFYHHHFYHYGASLFSVSSSSTDNGRNNNHPLNLFTTNNDKNVIRVIGPSYNDNARKNQQDNHDDEAEYTFLRQQQEMLLLASNKSGSATTTTGGVDNKNDAMEMEFHFFTRQEQKEFLQFYGDQCYRNPHHQKTIIEQFESLPFHLGTELWKYCVLYISTTKSTTTTSSTGAVMRTLYWDIGQVEPLISWNDLSNSKFNRDIFILVPDHYTSSTPSTSALHLVHHGWLQLMPPSPKQNPSSSTSSWLQAIIQYLMESSEHDVTMSKLAKTVALYVKQQHQLSSASETNTDTLSLLWKAKCAGQGYEKEESHMQISSSLPHHCPFIGSYCCQVWKNPSTSSSLPVLMLKHPLGPPPASSSSNFNIVTQRTGAETHVSNQEMQSSNNAENKSLTPITESTTPFMAVIYEQSMTPSMDSRTDLDQLDTSNFIDILIQNGCLPNTKECFTCLKRTKGGCEYCLNECTCYCRVLCNIRPEPKPVVGIYHVVPPKHISNGNHDDVQSSVSSSLLGGDNIVRKIPRIIHQTWYEDVTKSKYPNMSRLIESWKHSGWKHNFYLDEDMIVFLKKYFPIQVFEAYDALKPGAFKADLFRYCVLLIHGGVYADMDVLLESNLDTIIKPHMGFVTPLDDPGRSIQHRSCLWNGFLAVAPGHPIIAKTIQNVVNNVRNRFTSLDYDDMLCPNPVLSVSHSMDLLYTAGPCILGATVNNVLGRHPQSHFIPGEYTFDDDHILSHEIPGTIVLLQQNKEDMGAHRFTLTMSSSNIYNDEKQEDNDNKDEYDDFLLINRQSHDSNKKKGNENIIVCSTDLPDYDDRPKTLEHYSKSREKSYVYGLADLYKDNVIAGEELQFSVITSDS